MALAPFQWGSNGRQISPDEAKGMRAVAAALTAKSTAPKTLGEGLNRVGEALLAKSYDARATDGETEGAASRKAVMDALLANPDPSMTDIAGAASNDWVQDSPGAQAVVQALTGQEQQQQGWAHQDSLAATQRAQQLEDQQRARDWQVSDRKSDYKHDYSMMDAKADQPTVINDQLVNPQSGDVMGDYRTPPKPIDQPAAVDEYNWWAEKERTAGRTPMPYLDFVQAQKGSGLSITTPDGTVISQGGGKYGQTVGGGFGEAFMGIQNSALSAIQGKGTLDAMEQAMGDPNFYSGFGAEQLMGLKQAAAAMGINPDSVQSMETFNALSKKAALDAMGGSLGSGFSNADRGFVEQQVASLATTPDGNRQLIQLQRKLGERKIEIAQLANQYAQAKGGIDAGFTDFLAKWSEANPLFPQAAQPGTGGAVPGQPAAAAPAGPQSQPPSISSPQEYDALPPGSPYLAPDGTIRTKGQ